MIIKLKFEDCIVALVIKMDRGLSDFTIYNSR